MEILLNLRKNTSTHIVDYIHEWRRRCNLCKIEISPPFLLDWFLNSLLPHIAKYVAYTSLDEEAAIPIQQAQHFDLIYAQSGYLYTILPDAPRHLSLEAPIRGTSDAVDGLIGNVESMPPPYTPPKSYTPQH